MSAYTLRQGLYIHPTPAGSYYAVCSKNEDDARQFLNNMLVQPETQPLTLENLNLLTGFHDGQKCYDLLHRCQQLNWVQGLNMPQTYPSGLLEDILPSLLKPLSESGHVMLADKLGFSLASNGFQETLTEELAALSAELATVHERRPASIMEAMGISSHAWAMIDVFGNSQLGFWPLFIGENRFVIIISGVPHFNQPEFIDLIWALSKRYADIS